MRVWRRIADDPKFGRTSWSDVQVRTFVQTPSIDTYLRRRRLTYLSRVAGAELDCLHAALQQRGKFGEKLPWITMITNDLCILKRWFPNKLADLPLPSDDIGPYWRIARDFPHEWKALVRQLCDVEDDSVKTKRTTDTTIPLSAPLSHACDVCDKQFASARQLSCHKWSKHRTRCNIRQVIGDISCCPVCKTDFFSRARLVKHLLEKRVRSRFRAASCRELFLRSNPEMVPADCVQFLETRDAAVAKAARREGHTSLIADRPCQRHGPSILKRKAMSTDLRPKKRLRVKTRLVVA